MLKQSKSVTATASLFSSLLSILDIGRDIGGEQAASLLLPTCESL